MGTMVRRFASKEKKSNKKIKEIQRKSRKIHQTFRFFDAFERAKFGLTHSHTHDSGSEIINRSSRMKAKNRVIEFHHQRNDIPYYYNYYYYYYYYYHHYEHDYDNNYDDRDAMYTM